MWIDSKQLDADGQLKPCTTPQCDGFTLEAELGSAKNNSGEPAFLGWEVKQFAVEDFERVESAKPITMMTPEPDDGFYNEADAESFIRKFGYADKNDKPDRLNCGGWGARLCEPQHFRNERAMEFSTPTEWRSCCGSQTRAPVRLAQGTDSLRLLRAFAAGAVYYDPGIKLECLRTATSVHRAGEGQEAEPVSRGVEEHRRAL